MVLKMQCKQLCQVQKAVPMMLHGNGVHKQVLLFSISWLLLLYNRFTSACNLLMITVSVTAAANIVKALSDKHEDVISWETTF